MSCHGFSKIKNPIVILKCPKRMLEYYFLKGFNLFDCDINNLAKILSEVKVRTHT